VRLLSFEGKNILSIGHVKLSLEALGLTLVTGYSLDEGSSNGAGKSSIANKGVIWTLWGQTAGGLKADHILNRHGKKNGFGEVPFIGVDGATYKVRRERPAKLSLFRNGKDVSAKKAVDTQKLIDEALGQSFATFIQTSFFGQGRVMSYPSLTPKEQKALLEEILPMEEIDRWAKYADVEAKKLAGTLDASQRKITQIETEKSTLKRQQEEATVRAGEWELEQKARIEAKEAEILDREQRRDKELGQLKKSREKFAEAEITTSDLIDAIETRTADLEQVKAEEDEARSSVHEAGLVLKQWNDRLIGLNATKKELENSTSCPTCLRPYDNNTVNAVKARTDANDALTVEAKANVDQAHEAVNFYKQNHQSKGVMVGDLVRKVANLANQLDQFKALDQREEMIEHDFSAMISVTQSSIKAIEEEANPHYDYITGAVDRLTQLEDLWLDAQKALGLINSEHEHLIYWRDVYSKELKLRLFETCCDFLDCRTAEHLKGLRNEQIQVEFSTVKRLASGTSKDEFSVQVLSTTGGIGFDSLSGGEQQIASFAVGLALADLASSRVDGNSEFLILDEPFSQLDDRNSEAIVEYLTGDLGKSKDTILLISNEDSLKGLIPSRIHVVKENGITGIENGR
jgi:DNA repair exonuclease SbcCD ATPase subunit